MVTTTHVRSLATRVRRTWSELDYAQRRVFELQTGIAVTGSRGGRDHGRPERRPRAF